MKVIELKNISKKFEITHQKRDTLKENFIGFMKRGKNKKEAVWAVKDITFDVEKGECIGIVGENAAGKTTLLKIIGKVMRPTEGNVVVRGKIAPLLTLGIGFEQELTAKENVYLYGSIMGLSQKQIDEKYKKIVRFSELEHFMNAKLKTFSSGMSVRLGFATAVNVDADILLVDEVLSVGDGAFQKKCLDKFEEFKKEGKTILYVSHSTGTIKKYCDKVIFLHRGKIKAFGETEKIVEMYERHLINKQLKTYNSDIIRMMRELGDGYPSIKDLKIFNYSREEYYALEAGTSFYLLFIPVNVPPDTTFIATIQGNGNRIILLSKSIKENIVRFKVESLALDKGEYEVSIGCLTIKNIAGPYKFKFYVTKGDKGASTNRVFIESPRKLYSQMIVFGEDYENIIKDFENGGTLVAFEDIEEAERGFKEGAFFFGGKPVFRGTAKEVIEKYNSHVYETIKDVVGV